MTDQLSVLSRVLIGACSYEEAAYDLKVSVAEIVQMQQAVAAVTVNLVPISVSFPTRRVEFLDLCGSDYTEPFFSDTIKKVRACNDNVLNFEASFEDFLRAGNRTLTQPRGFVFHVGRCGSTLLANMLQTSCEYTVLKEPDILSHLLAVQLTATDSSLQIETEHLIEAALRTFAAIQPKKGLIVKTAAWNIRLANLLLTLAPDANAIFLYRNPVETVTSLMYQRPAWFELIEKPRPIQALFFPTLANVAEDIALSPTMLFAHAWLSVAETALNIMPKRLLTINYAELVGEPLRVMRKVLAHLGARSDNSVLTRLSEISKVYSKDPQQRAPYDPSGKHFRPTLDIEKVEDVQRITSAGFDRLEALRII